MIAERTGVRFLASVTSAAEAHLAVASGADIIDCKDPAAGALGALAQARVADIRRAVPRAIPVSATIGDLVPEPEALVAAAAAMAGTGVDTVKIGFFPGGDPRSSIRALGRLQGCRDRLVGLLLADLEPDLSLIDDMADAGFVGVMLDTADKASGTLPDVFAPRALAAFIERVQAHGLLAGLAGSLRLADVPALLGLRPDILGFRGALCAGGRTGSLDKRAVASIRRAIPSARTVAPRAAVIA